MSKLTLQESERIDLAAYFCGRALGLYKQKHRRGKDLEKLKLLEQAANALNAARLL